MGRVRHTVLICRHPSRRNPSLLVTWLCPVFDFEHVVLHAIAQTVRISAFVPVVNNALSDGRDTRDYPFPGLELFGEVTGGL